MTSHSAMEYKEEGNRYYKNSDYARALSSYSKAIELDCSNPIFHSNRAQCKIQMGLPHEAIPDVREAIKLDPSQVKYSYRLAMALSGIGEHEEAYRMLVQHSNEHDDIPGSINRVEKYIENSNGIFDMDEMLRLAKEKKEIEIEDYFGPISIELAGKKGRGLFALRDIKKGELVFVSKSKIFAKEPLDIKPRLIPNSNFNKVAFKLMEIIREMIIQFNPLTICRLAMIFGSGINDQPLFPSVKLFSPKGYELLIGNEEFYSSQELKDQLLQKIGNIVIKNYISSATFIYILPTLSTKPDIRHGPDAGGIWFIHSFQNHSCLPNTFISFAGNICIARANSDILKGTELTAAYVNPVPSKIDSISLFTIKERREYLKADWNIICNCELCQYESDPKNQHLFLRSVKLHYRVCKVLFEKDIVTKLSVNSYFRQLEILFSEVIKLAEDMGLGANRFNDTVWNVMRKIFHCYMYSAIKFKVGFESFFRIMDRAFFCEKELQYETRYWFMYMQMIILSDSFTPLARERHKRVEENFNRVKALQMYF